VYGEANKKRYEEQNCNGISAKPSEESKVSDVGSITLSNLNGYEEDFEHLEPLHVSVYSTRPTEEAQPMFAEWIISVLQNELYTRIEFAGILKRYRGLYEQLAAEADRVLSSTRQKVNLHYYPCYQYVLVSDNDLPASCNLPNKTQELFENQLLRLEPLTTSQSIIDGIVRDWPYSSPTTPRHLSELLPSPKNIPSPHECTRPTTSRDQETEVAGLRNIQGSAFGIFTETDKMIAWCVRQSYGALGMVHVDPEWRRMGIGERVVWECCNSLLSFRKVFGHTEKLNSEEIFDVFSPYCYIIDTNVPSMKMFTKLGFKQFDEVDWCTWTIERIDS
jgi:ribosomal protein S18 acetylase RimI-like enzyme